MATVGSFDRITVEPGKCGGKPCIRGMRITVRHVLELLASHPDGNALLAEYPSLEPEDLQQALRYAAAHLCPTPTLDKIQKPTCEVLYKELKEAWRYFRDALKCGLYEEEFREQIGKRRAPGPGGVPSEFRCYDLD